MSTSSIGPLARRAGTLLAVALLAGTSAFEAAAADTLSTALFSDRSESLWPLAVALEITDAESGELVIPRRELVVADGQHTVFSEALATPQGEHLFEIELVARHHIEAIELEYDLKVRDARFEQLDWGDYWLHRLALAPRPELGPEGLAAARADIVETQREGHCEHVSVGEDRYAICLYAQSLRG